MSVVLDAVNSFFGPTPSHHQYPFAQHEPPRHDQHPPPTKRSHTPPRSDTPMSAPEQRPGSSAAATTTSQHNDQACDAPAPQMTSQQSASQPSSSPLAARPAPSSGGSQAVPQASSAPDTPAAGPQRSRPAKIKVRDLEHIQSFASEDMGAFSENGSRSRSNAGGEESPQYEISEMKVEHIIEMVAGLLTKITTTNDQQHEHVHRQPPQTDGGPHLDPQTTSVLAFHGKNVPSITILSYLSRINKYCPTSYEVFLSLLVYFDRMTERVNARPMQSLRQANEAAMSSSSASSDSLSSEQMEDVRNSLPDNEQMVTPPSSGSMDKPTTAQGTPGTPYSRPAQPDSPAIPPELGTIDPYNLSQFFVVDSFNIHRLVIAGVTCASKFFSDIFYTNSRYAKVGGLPLPELNHLELQFLLLNDFRLSVPVEEIEAYGTMLVEFYAREVVAQQKAAQAAEAAAMQVRSLSESSSDSTSTVRAAM